MSPTRRDVLKAGVGTAALGSFAGCLDVVGLGDDGVDADGYTAFFALWDFAEQVSGDEKEFAEPVGPGRMGHGWSPDSDLTPNIASTEIFFYLDTPEFSWAQDAATNLERDHSDDVAVVDLLQGVRPYLIPADGGAGERMPDPADREFSREELLIEEWNIWDLRSSTVEGYWHDTDPGHWHGTAPDILVDGTLPIGIDLREVDGGRDAGDAVPLGDDERFRVDATIVDGDEDAVDIEVEGREVRFHAQELGTVEVVYEFYDDGEQFYDTSSDPDTIAVVEEIDDDEDDEFHDPHAWIDPVIVQEIVDEIAAELGELDPDNADYYEENAAAYNEDVAAVDEEIESVVADAALDTAVFVGHDSFQYVANRYDIEFVTPVGISPDAAASQSDIGDLLDVIESNGIDTVLYDPFEVSTPGEDVPDLVQSIFENSEVENAEPLTPVEGITEEWEDNDWGWVDQMKEVNIPSLERALNPE